MEDFDHSSLDVQKKITFKHFPTEVISKILNFTGFDDPPALYLADKLLLSTIRSSPYIEMHCKYSFMKRLKILFLDFSDGCVTLTWNQLMRKHDALLLELKKLPSPGCKFQKYLRWLENKPADCFEVRRAIFGASLLPASLDVFSLRKQLIFTEQFQLALTIMLSPFNSLLALVSTENFNNYYDTGDDDELIRVGDVYTCNDNSCWQKIMHHFDPARYFRLLEWLIGNNKRLRQLMAEVNQIKCRGVTTFIRRSYIHPRQNDACLQIINLTKMDDSLVKYWAT